MSFGDVRITGDKRLIATFRKLPERVGRSAVRKAVNFGATPIVQAARKRIPRESGLSRKALNKRVKTYPANQGVVAIIGVRRDEGGTYKGRRRVPQFYQHLIHDGHIARDGTFVPGSKYLDKAYNAALSTAQKRMEQRLSQEIIKEAAKL